MADHIVRIPDEMVLDYIRTIDGDTSNDALIQRVMDGHYTEWEKMFKVSGDRNIIEKYVMANETIKASVFDLLKDVSVIKEEPIGKI